MHPVIIPCGEGADGPRVGSGSTMGQAVSGVVDVSDTAVAMDLRLPGVPGMLASGIAGRIQQAGQSLLEKE